MRKIIQISAIPAFDLNEHNSFINDETLYALCDDGTVFWLIAGGEDDGWTRLPPIPQGDEDDEDMSPPRDGSP